MRLCHVNNYLFYYIPTTLAELIEPEILMILLCLHFIVMFAIAFIGTVFFGFHFWKFDFFVTVFAGDSRRHPFLFLLLLLLHSIFVRILLIKSTGPFSVCCNSSCKWHNCESYEEHARSRRIPHRLCMCQHILQRQHELVHGNIAPCHQHPKLCHHPVWEVNILISLKTQKLDQLGISYGLCLKA